MRLKGKTAIVTGAGQGLGEGMALRFAQEGATVVVVDKNPETAPAVVRRIEEAGGRALAVVTDLYQVANIEKMVEPTMGVVLNHRTSILRDTLSNLEPENRES